MLVSRGSTLCREQDPAAQGWVLPPGWGEPRWQLCCETVESLAAGMQWERSTSTLMKAELPLQWPLCAWGAEESPSTTG